MRTSSPWQGRKNTKWAHLSVKTCVDCVTSALLFPSNSSVSVSASVGNGWANSGFSSTKTMSHCNQYLSFVWPDRLRALSVLYLVRIIKSTVFNLMVSLFFFPFLAQIQSRVIDWSGVPMGASALPRMLPFSCMWPNSNRFVFVFIFLTKCCCYRQEIRLVTMIASYPRVNVAFITRL